MKQKKNRAMKSFVTIISIFVLFMIWSASANSDEYAEVKTLSLRKEFKTKSDWYVTAYHLKEGGADFIESKTPAKICFWTDDARKDQSCFPAIEGPYKYHEVKELSIVELQKTKEPKKGVLFVSQYHGISIRNEFYISIWAYDRERDRFIKVLPMVSLTDQCEYKLLSVLKRGVEGVFVTADGIWVVGEEGRYEAHKFRITIYKYSTEKAAFVLAGQYTTGRKYKSFDDAETIDVIRHELNSILKYLEK